MLRPSPPTEILRRLTEGERACLALVLDHRTAKQIALELGITHHAVEKRLKRAREKLGAQSSIEAARWAAGTDELHYGQTGYGAPDLPTRQARPPLWQHPAALIGGIVMIFAALTALTLYPAQDTETVFVLKQNDNEATVLSKPANEIEISRNVEAIFAQLDEDESGYLEKPETPFFTMTFADAPNEGEASETRNGKVTLAAENDTAQLIEFYTAADTNQDGRVSFREYYGWSEERLAQSGVQIKSVVKVLKPSES